MSWRWREGEGEKTGTGEGAGAAAGQLEKILKKSIEKVQIKMKRRELKCLIFSSKRDLVDFFKSFVSQGKEEQEQGQKRTLLERGDD